METQPVKYTSNWDSFFLASSYPLAVFNVKEEETLTPMHQHEFNELVIITSGHGTYCDQTNEYQLKPGDVFLLRPGMPHSYINQRHLAVTNILWLEDKLKMPLYDLQNAPGYHAFFELDPLTRSRNDFATTLNLDSGQLPEAERILRGMQMELTKEKPGALLSSVGLFSQLLVFLCRCYANTLDSNQLNLLRFEKVIIYMNQHYMESVSRPKLAALAAMSESSFYRHFTATTGKTPSAYLTDIRMHHAETMLCTTTLGLEEIALSCGFCDGNYFCTLFKRYFNQTPHQYRLQYRNRI